MWLVPDRRGGGMQEAGRARCGSGPPAGPSAGGALPPRLAVAEALEAAPLRVHGKVARPRLGAGPSGCCGGRSARALGRPGRLEGQLRGGPAAPAPRRRPAVSRSWAGAARVSALQLAGGACSRGGGAGPEWGGRRPGVGARSPRTTRGTRWFCR